MAALPGRFEDFAVYRKSQARVYGICDIIALTAAWPFSNSFRIRCDDFITLAGTFFCVSCAFTSCAALPIFVSCVSCAILFYACFLTQQFIQTGCGRSVRRTATTAGSRWKSSSELTQSLMGTSSLTRSHTTRGIGEGGPQPEGAVASRCPLGQRRRHRTAEAGSQCRPAPASTRHPSSSTLPPPPPPSSRRPCLRRRTAATT